MIHRSGSYDSSETRLAPAQGVRFFGRLVADRGEVIGHIRKSLKDYQPDYESESRSCHKTVLTRVFKVLDYEDGSVTDFKSRLSKFIDSLSISSESQQDTLGT